MPLLQMSSRCLPRSNNKANTILPVVQRQRADSYSPRKTRKNPCLRPIRHSKQGKQQVRSKATTTSSASDIRSCRGPSRACHHLNDDDDDNDSTLPTTFYGNAMLEDVVEAQEKSERRREVEAAAGRYLQKVFALRELTASLGVELWPT